MPEGIANVDVSEIPASPEFIEALQDVFWEWYGANYAILEDGGTGNVYDLLLMFNAACWKAKNSLSSTASAL